MRCCARCQSTKRLDKFAKDKRRRGGRGSYCRPCAAEIARAARVRYAAYYEGYERDRLKADPERNKRWRHANPEKARANSRRDHERNREAANARRREHYLKNKDQHRATMRKWHEENPDAAHDMRARRRTRERNAYVEPICELVALELVDGACGICGGDVDPLAFEIDHAIPLAAGGLHNQENAPRVPPCSKRRRRFGSEPGRCPRSRSWHGPSRGGSIGSVHRQDRCGARRPDRHRSLGVVFYVGG